MQSRSLATIGIQLTVVNGPLARRVADLQGALELTAGPTRRDPWTVPAPLRGPKLPRPIRVAVVLDPAGQGTAKQVQDGVRKAARALEDVGYVVEEVEPPSIDAAAQALVAMLSTPGTRALWQQVMAPWLPAPTRQFMAAFFDAAGNPDAVAAEESFIIRHALLRSWAEFQESYPVIVAPIAADIPSVAGMDLDEGQVAKDLTTMRMAMAGNALGLPAVAVPVGIQDGLPQAIEVIGPRYGEDLCLAAAA